MAADGGARRASMCPFGAIDVEARIHRGAMFDVYRVSRDGVHYALKTPTGGFAADRIHSTFASGVATSLWGGATGAGAHLDGDVDASWVLDRLLGLEAEAIRRSGGEWNHHVVACGTWDGDDDTAWRYRIALDDARFRPALLTPLHAGTPFTDIDPALQRTLFPRMLPAMWDALAYAPHGDVGPRNTIVSPDLSRFALIDPGVALYSLDRRDGDAGGYMNHILLFTTTAELYPLLPPTYVPPIPELELSELDVHLQAFDTAGAWHLAGPVLATSGLLDPLDAYTLGHLAGGLELAGVSAEPRPRPADLLAAGIWYYAILTGAHPLDAHRRAQPRWYGSFGEGRGGAPASPEPVAAGFVAARERTAGLSDGEAALVDALLALRITGREQLARLAGDAVA